MTEVQNEKKAFIESLGKMLAEFNTDHKAAYFSDVKRLDYVEQDSEEFLYITCKEGLQKRVCITCDSIEAIMQDFVMKTEKASWLAKTDSRYHSEFVTGKEA